MHHKLAQCEDDMTINFINECRHLMPSNIEEVEPHVYLFPTSLQGRLDGYDIYGKLMKNRVTFCAQSCSRSVKRDSSLCYYKDTNGKWYGRILGFIKMDPPSAVERQFKVKTQSLLYVSGPA